MGQFALVVSGMGNHGCDRSVKDGEAVLGCQRPDCVDCILREVVRRLRRNGVSELAAELVHWPASVELVQASEAPTAEPRTTARYAIVYPQASTVVDNLVTGIRSGAF